MLFARRNAFALILLLGTVTLVFWRLTPRVGDSPVSFDALQRHVADVAAEPHPAGSAANDRVRDYLVDQLRQLGLDAQIAFGSLEGRRGVLPLDYIHCRLPATPGDATPGVGGLLVAAHYDSVPSAPGAADDGAALAGLLETARLLRDEPVRRRDVTILITGAEEAGLLGARLWAQEHPDRMGCTDALNFEARGTSGPAILFETAGRPADLIDAYAASSPRPVTSSVAAAVYERLPNDTDFTVFADAGLRGLNFAFIDGYANYHTPRDDVEHLSPGSLWHQAAQMHAVARRLAVEPPVAQDRPIIYFDVLSAVVVRYPESWAWPVALVAVAMAGAAAWRLRPRAWRVAATLGRLALHAVLTAGAVWLVIRFLPIDKAAHRWTPLAFAAAWAFVLAMLAMLVKSRRPRDRRVLIAATLLVLSAATLATAWAFKPGSYAVAWPTLFVAFGSLAPVRIRRIALTLAALASTLILLPLAWLATVALTMKMLAFVVPILSLVSLVWFVVSEPARGASRDKPPVSPASAGAGATSPHAR